MTVIDSTPRTGLRGWQVGAGICAFFAVVIGVDTTFTVMALRSHPGEVSVTPYEDGLLYNRHISQMAAQSRLGWRASAAAEPGQVALEFRDAAGAPVTGLTIDASLKRPATETGRLAPRFRETAPGRYEAPTGAISGAWDLAATAQDARGERFETERRLTWR